MPRSCKIASTFLRIIFFSTFFLQSSTLYARENDIYQPEQSIPTEQRDSDFNTQGTPSLYDVEVYGRVDRLGYYYLYLNVGTPPQPQTLIVDTGSTILSFTCSDCSSCGHHISEKFLIHNSNTSYWTTESPYCINKDPQQRCQYSINYAEGSSLKGTYFTDFLSLGDDLHHSPLFQSTNIGCHQVETNLFTGQMVSGIIGLGKKLNSPNSLEPLLRHFPPENNLFSLCLSNEGGLLTIGGYTTHLIPPNTVQWIPLSTHKSFKINASNMKLNGKSLFIMPQGFTIDSGTTYSLFPSEIYKLIAKSLKSAKETSSHYCELCWSKIYYEELINILPTFQFEFEDNVIINWEPKSYLVERPNEYIEAGITEGVPTLGMTFMKHHLVVFDQQNNQIGISDAHCPAASDVHTSTSNHFEWWKVSDALIYPSQNTVQNEKSSNTSSVTHPSVTPQEPNNNISIESTEYTEYIKQFIDEVITFCKANPFTTISILFSIILTFILLMYIIKWCIKKRKSNDYIIIRDQQQESWTHNNENAVELRVVV